MVIYQRAARHNIILQILREPRRGPPRYAVIQRLHAYLGIVFVCQTVFKYLELQLSDSAKDNIIKLIVVNLYRTFLCKLLYTLLELLCFQGIDRVYPCEKLRGSKKSFSFRSVSVSPIW